MHSNDSPLNSAKLLEVFFRDFYYDLLKCKEIALRTTRLDAELSNLDGGVAAEGTAGGEGADKSPPPPPSETTTDAGAAPSPEEAAAAEAADEMGAANKNQHPLLMHAIKDVPVHAVKAADEIQTLLKKRLTEQTNKIVHLLDQTDSFQFKDAQYAMVALADEVFLTCPWSGQELWQKYLLESQVFQSQSAGTNVFQKIDELLSKYDPSRKSLATVYLNVLALGFKGKFRDSENLPSIKNYERRLYAFIYGDNPALSKYTIQKLMPECEESTLTSDLPMRLPNVKFWTLVFASIVLLFLIGSYASWYNVAHGLYRSLDSIFDQFQIFLGGNI
ncbi:MAG: DotU family type IV/VI secretion system protein [Holosporales bacterium]|jgi:type VI secretion system protein ImpK|nr:DotU family type IV/VI secretion system protein [Holosporales bacterium]